MAKARINQLKEREKEAISVFLQDAIRLHSILQTKPLTLYEVSIACSIFRKMFVDESFSVKPILKVLNIPCIVLDFSGEPYDCDTEISRIDSLQIALAPKPPFVPWETKLCTFTFERFLNQRALMSNGRWFTNKEVIKHYANKHGVHFDDFSDNLISPFAIQPNASPKAILHSSDRQISIKGAPAGVASFYEYAIPLWAFIDYLATKLVKEDLLQIGQSYGVMGELSSLGPWSSKP